eukprot:TRINITY_DN11566_c0_g1_i1.p1 TRINITY_DN11566_c0_g1~~TRINITY_DN11566_c0_g1_i1.p1  ORF type:complete len:1003 (+),score=139.78 TRINITY_DN11566_c0_g1_i1:41-3010(+)
MELNSPAPRKSSRSCKCTYCGEVFADPSLLSSHSRQHIIQPDLEARPNYCTACNKSFKASNYARHFSSPSHNATTKANEIQKLREEKEKGARFYQDHDSVEIDEDDVLEEPATSSNIKINRLSKEEEEDIYENDADDQSDVTETVPDGSDALECNIVGTEEDADEDLDELCDDPSPVSQVDYLSELEKIAKELDEVDTGVTPKKPKKAKGINTQYNNKIAQALCKAYRLSGISDRAMKRILYIASRPGFTWKDVPPNLDALKEVEAQNISVIPKEKLTDPRLTKPCLITPLKAILQHAVSQKEIFDDFAWRFDPNGGKIERYNNTDNWKLLEKEFDRAGTKSAKKRRLYIILFADAYRTQSHRPNSTTGIYVAIANSQKIVRKYTLAMIPSVKKKKSYDDVLRHIIAKTIVPTMQEMERHGIELLTPEGKTEEFFGSIFAVAGDDIGQRCIAGLPTPKGYRCSRLSLLRKVYFIINHRSFPFQDAKGNLVKLIRRDPTESKRVVDEFASALESRISGTITAARDRMRENGLVARSPLWDLPIFSQHFFKRFMICHMHLCLEGNFKRHLEYLAYKYGPVVCEAINAEYQKLSSYPNILDHRNGIYQTESTELKLFQLVGEEMEGILQSLELIFAGHISKEDLDCLGKHLYADKLLTKEPFHRDDIPVLADAIDSWRKAFHVQFRKVNKCSLTYPNLETEAWWTTIIPFLGTARMMSTKLWEYENYKNKEFSNRGNKKDVEQNGLILREKVEGWERRTDLIIDNPTHRKPRKDFDVTGKPKPIKLGSETIDAIKMTFNFNNKNVHVSNSAKSFGGFNLAGHIIKPGTWLQVLNKNNNEVFFLKLQRVMRTQFDYRDNTTQQLQSRWMTGRYFTVADASVPIGVTKYWQLKEEQQVRTIPLAWGGFKILKSVQIIEKNTPTIKGLFYNSQVRREIGSNSPSYLTTAAEDVLLSHEVNIDVEDIADEELDDVSEAESGSEHESLSEEEEEEED